MVENLRTTKYNDAANPYGALYNWFTVNTGTTHWLSPNEGANNETEFSAM